jgi:hypothetical protein
MPGDLVAAGTCNNDPALLCDLDADCTKVTSSALTKDPAACEASGGLVGQGSVCTGCVLP